MKRVFKLILAVISVYIVFILLVDNFFIENSAPEKADFIVVISGGDTAGRTKKGVELYKQAYAPKLLLSGDAADPESPSNAAVMRNFAIKNGVKPEDIVIEENSKNTQENALESIPKLITVGPQQKILLVTSPYHSRRARIEFERAFKNQTISADVISVNATDKHWPRRWWLRPRALITVTFEILRMPFVLMEEIF